MSIAQKRLPLHANNTFCSINKGNTINQRIDFLKLSNTERLASLSVADRDELSALRLRFSFQDHSFNGLWKLFVKCGWTHRNGFYKPHTIKEQISSLSIKKKCLTQKKSQKDDQVITIATKETTTSKKVSSSSSTSRCSVVNGVLNVDSNNVADASVSKLSGESFQQHQEPQKATCSNDSNNTHSDYFRDQVLNDYWTLQSNELQDALDYYRISDITSDLCSNHYNSSSRIADKLYGYYTSRINTYNLQGQKIVSNCDDGKLLVSSNSGENQKELILKDSKMREAIEDYGRSLRDDIIYEYFKETKKREQKRLKGTISMKKDVEFSKDIQILKQQHEEEPAVRRSNRVQQQQQEQHHQPGNLHNRKQHHIKKQKSVTCVEPGADLHFRKPQKSSDQMLSSFELLSLEECAELAASVAKKAEESFFNRKKYDNTTNDNRDKKPDDVFLEQEQDYCNTCFSEWTFLLSTNNSILLFGYGSKYNLLNHFANSNDGITKRDGSILIIDGFDPEITVDGVLDLFMYLFLPDIYKKINNNEEDTHISNTNTSSMDKTNSIIPEVTNDGLETIIEDNKNNIDTLSLAIEHASYKNYKKFDAIQKARWISRKIAKSIATSKDKKPIFLIVHNIDGISLRNRLMQKVLAAIVSYSFICISNKKNSGTIAKIRSIRLIASIDHIDTYALLWDLQTMMSFQFLWKEVHTYRPYFRNELMMILNYDEAEQIRYHKRNKKQNNYNDKITVLSTNARKVIKNRNDDHNMITDVLTSLAPRHTEVLKILAKLQLDCGSSTVSSTKRIKEITNWVNLSDLRQQCFNNCIIKSAYDLRNYIIELDDHELIAITSRKQVKNTNGDNTNKNNNNSAIQPSSCADNSWIRIPCSNERLLEILGYNKQK